MALLTIEGVYEDGKVELHEQPSRIPPRTRVLVTFLSEEGRDARADELLERQRKRREAAERLLARMREGISFGGPPYPKREDLYDRFNSGDG
jgi:hypothetical protein